MVTVASPATVTVGSDTGLTQEHRRKDYLNAHQSINQIFRLVVC